MSTTLSESTETTRTRRVRNRARAATLDPPFSAKRTGPDVWVLNLVCFSLLGCAVPLRSEGRSASEGSGATRSADLPDAAPDATVVQGPKEAFPRSVAGFAFDSALSAARLMCPALIQSSDPELPNVWSCPRLPAPLDFQAAGPVELVFYDDRLGKVTVAGVDSDAGMRVLTAKYGPPHVDAVSLYSWHPAGGWVRLSTQAGRAQAVYVQR